MKRNSLIYFILFVCSLVLGYSVSTSFYHPSLDLLPDTGQLVASTSLNSMETMDNGQRSILLIQTSSLNTPDPQLEGMWLATYFASDTTIQLLPIYPEAKPAATGFEQELTRAFSLEKQNGNRVLGQEFKDELKRENYWWSAYIVFDEVVTTGLFDRIGGIELNGKTLSGAQAVQAVASAQIDPREAYTTQIAMLQSACHKIQGITPEVNLSKLSSISSRYILTDLDPSQLQAEVLSFYSNHRKPTCRFPTLEISGLVH